MVTIDSVIPMLSQLSAGMLEVFENGTTTTVVGAPSDSLSIVWPRTTEDTALIRKHAAASASNTALECFMFRSDSVQVSRDLSLVDEPGVFGEMTDQTLDGNQNESGGAV